MELVEQDGLPQPAELLPGIGPAAQGVGQHGEGLRLVQEHFALAVVPLVLGDGGISAPVVFQVQLPHPPRDTSGLRGAGAQVRLQLGHVVLGGVDPGPGQAGEAPGRAPLGFQIVAGGAAAAVAEAVSNDRLVGELLLLEAVPGAQDHRGLGGAGIGRVDVPLAGLGHVPGGAEAGEHLAAVDALPEEGVIGQLVVLVPADLGGKELIHPGFPEDLGQGGAVAEHVRQPEDVAVHPELLLHEPLAVEDLTDQALAGGEVAVGLQPHGALHLPAALLDPLEDLPVELRGLLFHILVELGLGGHEPVLGVLLHQPQDGGEAPLDLLPGLGQGPQPCHVDVGVAHAVDQRGLSAAVLLDELLPQAGPGGLHALIESGAEGTAQVHQLDGPLQAPQDSPVGIAPLVQTAGGVQRHLQVVVQPVHCVVQPDELHPALGGDLVGTGVEVEVGVVLPARGEEDFLVVDIQALDHFAVEVQEALGAHGVPDGVTAGLQPEKEPVAGFLRRGGEGDVEPVVGVLAPDGVLPAPGHPVPLRRGIGGLVARGQAGNAFQGLRGGLPERRQLLNDDTDLLK